MKRDTAAYGSARVEGDEFSSDAEPLAWEADGWEDVEWHKQLLDERLADAEANPDDSVPWDHVREELEAKFRGAK